MPKVYVKQSGTWKQVLQMWVKQAGTWKAVTAGLVTSGGIGKQFFPDTIGKVSYSAAGTYTYTVPAGVTSLIVKSVGAGGGGQAGAGNYSGAGGGGAGGGAGSTSDQTITVTPGSTLTIVVGAGGAGGGANVSGGTSPNGQAGSAGGASYISGFSSTNASGGAAGNKAAGTGNFPAGNPNGDWSGDGGSWWYGYAGANSSVSTGGTAGGIYTDGGTGGIGSGGGGGAASNYNPNDYSTAGGKGGDGLVSITAVNANFQNYTTSGTFSFTVPAGVTSLSATLYGAGGGSGACNNNGDAWVGGGGGAGGKATSTIAVTPGETLTFEVGAKGYGASSRFNSTYWYNPNNSTLGTGQNGGNTAIKRGSTTLVSANGGTGGVQYGYGVGGTPTVAGTSPPGHTGNGDGEQGSTPGYYGYGYYGPIKGGTNGSGTPPSGYGNAGTGYGNGGGQATYSEPGTDGQHGAILLSW